MSNKAFWIAISVLAVGFAGYSFLKKDSTPQEAISGIRHEDQDVNHIARGARHEPYNSNLSGSGPHYADSGAPAPWESVRRRFPTGIAA